MNSPTSLRILIADPHPVVREGVAAVLSRQPDMQVVAQAKNGQETLDLFGKLVPNVLVMEIDLPDMEGRELIATLTKRYPAACTLVLSRHDEEEYIYRALQAGAKGYCLKEDDPEALVAAVRLVCEGQRALAANMSVKLVGRLQRPELTTREQEVLVLLAAGHSNQEIGTKLFIAEGTVKVHVANILGKMDVSDRTQAVVAAIRRGLVSL